MAIQASGWLFLRDSYLVPFCEYPPLPDQYPDFAKREHPIMSEEDKEKLRKIIKEADQLRDKLSDHFYDPDPVTKPNVHLQGGVERILERSTDPSRSRELFEEIHGILKKYKVRPDVYRNLGRAFEELHIQPSIDTSRAINYFNQVHEQEMQEYQRKGFFPIEVRCWDEDDPEKDKR